MPPVRHLLPVLATAILSSLLDASGGSTARTLSLRNNSQVAVSAPQDRAASDETSCVSLDRRVLPFFQSSINLRAGGVVADVAAVDFNGDGFQDLAAAVPGAVAIFLNDGSGFFLSGGFRCTVAAIPQRLVFGDLNADGHADLIFTDFPSPFLGVMLGNGDGSFQPALSVSLMNRAQDIAAADLNADGYTDLAVTLVGSRYITVFASNGDGTFRLPQLYQLAANAEAIAIGDFNGDAIPDLTATNVGQVFPPQILGTVNVLLGTGDGSFREPLRFDGFSPVFSVDELIPGDFDRDGWLDVALRRSFPFLVTLVWGNGDGTFRGSANVDAGSGMLAGLTAADFNEDGAADLAVTTSGYGEVRVLLNGGDGTFDPPLRTFAGHSPSALVAADLNADGFSDLAVANASEDVSVRLSYGNGHFFTGIDLPVESNPIAVSSSDLNGDGFADVVTANGDANSVSVLINQPDENTFQLARHYPAGAFAVDVHLADFNSDGPLDLIVVNSSGRSVSVLLNNGDGTFQDAQHHMVGGLPRSVATGDFNEDGWLDCVLTQVAPDRLSVLLGNGDGTFRSGKDTLAGENPTGVVAVDFDRDGRLDVVTTNRLLSGYVSLLRGNGDGTFRYAQALRVGAVPEEVVTADFNGDGAPDLAVANEGEMFLGTGSVSVLLNRGAGSFDTQTYAISPVSGSLLAADANFDGVPDLAIGVRSGVGLLLSHGDGTFWAASRSFGASSVVAGVAAADFNRDDLIDLVFARAFVSPTISVLYQLGLADWATPGPGRSTPFGRVAR